MDGQVVTTCPIFFRKYINYVLTLTVGYNNMLITDGYIIMHNMNIIKQ